MLVTKNHKKIARQTNKQTRKRIEKKKTNRQKIQNEVIVNQNGNELQNNRKS